jgi:general secretion pathway protein G
MKSRSKGLTIIEVVIVLAMLAIVSLLVVPEFSQASPDVRDARLVEGLHSLRLAVREYREDHGGRLPDPERLEAQLTLPTNAAGDIAPGNADRSEYPLGPYLPAIPPNPFVNGRISRNVEVGRENPGGGNAGWYFNARTGVIYADDDAHGHL